MEVWKDIPGFEGAYQISDLGNVRSLDRGVTVKTKLGKDRRLFVKGQPIKVLTDKNGYKVVGLNFNRKQHLRFIHRLKYQAFINPRIDGKDIDHKDGNQANNDLDNLRECNRNNNLTYKNIKRDRKNPQVGAKLKYTTKKGKEYWVAQIWNPSISKLVTVSGFSNSEEAHQEYRRLRILFYGDDILKQE